MKSENKKYWFYVYPHVYFYYMQEKMLLYNTHNGLYIESNDKECIQLIKEIYDPQNLGAILVSKVHLSCSKIIDEIILKSMGRLVELQKQVEKPVNLLPILNVQRDVEKLILQNSNLLRHNIISYLSELDIFINQKCTQSCSHCKKYFRQYKSCKKQYSNVELSIDIIKNILSQIKLSSVSKINILGGNIFKYTQWSNLLEVISHHRNFHFHFWINYLNLIDNQVFSPLNMFFMEILVTFPIQIMALERLLKSCNRNFMFHFFIENEEQYGESIRIIDNLAIENYNFVPIYTGKNKSFFSKSIFLEKNDIFSSTISMREIFRNKKLNANDFGTFIIFPDGSVKANINTKILGNINEISILELIYRELLENTAWRVVRNNMMCNNCLYQFLCPPPSNYEKVIGIPNLCHVED